MRSRKRGRTIFPGGSPVVFYLLLAGAGITFCLLAGLLRTAGDTPSGGQDGFSPPSAAVSPESERPELSHKNPPVPESAAPSESEESLQDESAGFVDAYLASMTLREKLCQMLIVTPDAITGVLGTTVAGAVTKAALEKYPVGGLIHFSTNITSSEQIAAFNSEVQAFSKIPLFIATDEEGGRVGRLKSSIGAHVVGPMLSYEDGGEAAAYENAVILSEALKKHGFNTDFAPVADVWSNPENTAIGDRAYSADFASAATLVAAAVRGFGDSGVICALKHFPGHGDTHEDSHDGSVYIGKTLEELLQNEIKPFVAGIEAGADMVMAGHLIVPALDELPATLSKTLITDILRIKLGFDGVVITDSLAMNAMAKHYGGDYVAVAAVNAGVDMLLMPVGVGETVDALTRAVETGEISQGRIDESVARILALKLEHGIILE